MLLKCIHLNAQKQTATKPNYSSQLLASLQLHCHNCTLRQQERLSVHCSMYAALRCLIDITILQAELHQAFEDTFKAGAGQLSKQDCAQAISAKSTSDILQLSAEVCSLAHACDLQPSFLTGTSWAEVCPLLLP